MCSLYLYFKHFLNNSNCAIASKYYNFELHADLFYDVKVDEILPTHS